MTKQVKNYAGMNSEEKAKVIYDTMLKEDPQTLSELLRELSGEYTDNEILTVEDWIDYVNGEDIYTVIKIAQLSKNLDINDEYIRTSIYYYGYQTSDNVLDLVDKDEAVDWITNYLEDRSLSIDELVDKDEAIEWITNYLED